MDKLITALLDTLKKAKEEVARAEEAQRWQDVHEGLVLISEIQGVKEQFESTQGE